MAKKNNMLKKVLSYFLLLLMFVPITLWYETGITTVEANAYSRSSEGQLKVHFIDVGQADCILVQQGNKNMLIDGGTNESEGAIANYLHSQNISRLDYVVGTHAHEDHIGSLDYVINSFNIGEVYFPKQTSTTKCFQSFLNACKKKNLQFNTPVVGKSFKLGSAVCTILSPKSSSYKNINDSSIVLKITFGNTSFLMTGDAGKEAENEMLASGMNLKSDVLKVGHHGSKTASTDKFLNAVNPKYAVISVGRNNDYNLPNSDTITRIKKKNIKIYRTDESGTITAVSNGSGISFNY